VTVTGLPAIVSVAVRVLVVVLAVTATVTVPLPVPVLPPVMDTHALPPVAVQVQLAGALTVTEAALAVAPIAMADVDSV
jgi:hypothetical protein